MLILLPPSETKAPGGERDTMSVSFPALDSVRASLFDDLSAMDVDEMMGLLKIPKTKREEAVENQSLRTGPVMPAIYRYTGVLYDALDPETLPDDAIRRLVVGSALFGVVRADDMIPRYRVSASSKVPRMGRARWSATLISTTRGCWPGRWRAGRRWRRYVRSPRLPRPRVMLSRLMVWC